MTNKHGDPLTDRQKEVYQYVKSRIKDGMAPTLREIGYACYPHCKEVTGFQAASNCLKSLIKKGYLQRLEKISRGLFLTDLKP